MSGVGILRPADGVVTGQSVQRPRSIDAVAIQRPPDDLEAKVKKLLERHGDPLAKRDDVLHSLSLDPETVFDGQHPQDVKNLKDIAKALGKIKTKEAAQRLIDMFNKFTPYDPDGPEPSPEEQEVRKAIIDALRNNGTPEAIKFLDTLKQNGYFKQVYGRSSRDKLIITPLVPGGVDPYMHIPSAGDDLQARGKKILESRGIKLSDDVLKSLSLDRGTLFDGQHSQDVQNFLAIIHALGKVNHPPEAAKEAAKALIDIFNKAFKPWDGPVWLDSDWGKREHVLRMAIIDALGNTGSPTAKQFLEKYKKDLEHCSPDHMSPDDRKMYFESLQAIDKALAQIELLPLKQPNLTNV